ncbi:MAG: substrate-binding domain-containing protein [Verrucomicrobia bacterium]|nr:substrate-binding domain-containing protein [Verrucomicrobiota bacterium]
MKRILTVQILCLLLLSLVGCNDGGSGDGTFKVMFSQCNNAEPYRAAQNARMKALFASEESVSLVIMDGQADANKQISQIETAIRQKPSLLIVAPLEREPLSAVMGEAMAAGIPVICLERDIAEPNYTTYIRCDNRAIGREVGRWIVEHLTEKHGEPAGTIVELQGSQGVEGAINRHGGAQEVLAEYLKIKVVHDAVANWFQPEAMDRMSESLVANPPGTIDIVYGHNDPMAYGAYLAAKEKGREKEMVFIGIDGLPNEGAQYVKDGILSVSFEYPLCVDKAHEIGMKILSEDGFAPEKTYMMESRIIKP